MMKSIFIRLFPKLFSSKIPIFKQKAVRKFSWLMITSQFVKPSEDVSNSRPPDHFPELIVSHEALGYLIGFHESLLQHYNLFDTSNHAPAAALIKACFIDIFGEQRGTALFISSTNHGQCEECERCREEGTIELFEAMNGIRYPRGLYKILRLADRQASNIAS